jgi:hypothetical protein
MNSFACPCLNVRISIGRSSASGPLGVDGIVKEHLLFPPGTESEITVVSETEEAEREEIIF